MQAASKEVAKADGALHIRKQNVANFQHRVRCTAAAACRALAWVLCLRPVQCHRIPSKEGGGGGDTVILRHANGWGCFTGPAHDCRPRDTVAVDINRQMDVSCCLTGAPVLLRISSASMGD